jgi:hypothetical protein
MWWNWKKFYENFNQKHVKEAYKSGTNYSDRGYHKFDSAVFSFCHNYHSTTEDYEY